MQIQGNTFLPKPAGSYNVGCKVFYFTDLNRKERFSYWKNKRRFVKAKIWYPSDVISDKPIDYLNEFPSKLLLRSYSTFSNDIKFFDSIKSFQTNSYNNVPVSSKEDKFPVIFFSQGYYFGLDDFYTNFMENLASQGYIVVSITHPFEQVLCSSEKDGFIKINHYRMFKAYMQWKKVEFFHDKEPDPADKIKVNRILRAYFKGMKVFDKSLDIWVSDTQFVLDTLIKINNSDKGHLLYQKMDLEKIGTMGQSFGGAVAGQLCYVDKRFKAAVNFDCFQFGDIYKNSLNAPVLLFESENYPLWSTGNAVVYENTYPFYKIVLKGTRHFIFTDVSVFPLITDEKRKEITGTVDAVPFLKTINTFTTEFFDHYLKGKPFRSAEFGLDQTRK